jgi:hypothetical protein
MPFRASVPHPAHLSAPDRIRQSRALSLVEVMCSLFILGLVMLGLIGNFVQSRRVTEGAILHAAATALVYGMIEQIKDLDYATMLPNYEADPSVPKDANNQPTVTPPYIRLRLNQDKIVWLKVVHTTPTDEDDATASILPPQGPSSTPAPTATVAGALDNWLGSIPLSTVTGSMSQQINLNMWVWIDDISNKGVWAAENVQPKPDCADIKKITVIYTYSYQDGSKTRTIRDREVVLRTPYDQ